MVAYTKLLRKEKAKANRRERDQVKFIYLRFLKLSARMQDVQ